MKFKKLTNAQRSGLNQIPNRRFTLWWVGESERFEFVSAVWKSVKLKKRKYEIPKRRCYHALVGLSETLHPSLQSYTQPPLNAVGEVVDRAQSRLFAASV
jgi:hypothetical protein